MAKRVTKKVIQNITSEQFEAACAEYASSDAKEAKVNADMDVQFTRIREKNADELATLKERKEKALEVLQAYCSENYDALFSKKKSMEIAHGVIGFRTGTPKLKTRKGFTWESVQTLIKKLNPFYIRPKEELNKELLLADREKLKTELADYGLEVVQDEVFFVELKKEEV